MKIKIQQFLFNKNHSWSIVGQNIGRALIKLNHDVHFFSTDGLNQKYIPEDLKPYIIEEINSDYDCQISYTAPHNWPTYLNNGKKNKFAIWNYEYNNKKDCKNVILEGFAKFHEYTTFVLPSSNFTKDVFLNMGIPNEKMKVVPHGINIEDYSSNSNKWKLKTNKTTKILLNVAQPHKRKALHLALESFGKAFSKKDDVCLIAKIFINNNNNNQFDVDFLTIYKNFEKKFPNHADVEFVYDYIPNISELYNACDVNFSATYAECWHLPSLEAMASNIINVVPNYGGQLDFCNHNNSLLINGKIVRAPRDHQYWKFNPFAVHFEIDTNDAAEKLLQAVNNKKYLYEIFLPNMISTTNKYTWENVAKQIIEMCNV